MKYIKLKYEIYFKIILCAFNCNVHLLDKYNFAFSKFVNIVNVYKFAECNFLIILLIMSLNLVYGVVERSLICKTNMVTVSL